MSALRELKTRVRREKHERRCAQVKTPRLKRVNGRWFTLRDGGQWRPLDPPTDAADEALIDGLMHEATKDRATKPMRKP